MLVAGLACVLAVARPGGAPQGTPGLAGWQQAMVDDLVRRHPRGPRPAVCFAPGTPAEQVAKFYTDAPDSLDGYRLSTRWSFTATNGGGLGQGDPTTLTWSIVPDGTSIGGFVGEPTSPSSLVAFLNGIYGSQSAWLPLLEQVFAAWAAETGNTYVYQASDDGASFPFTAGALGVRGDVRIGGHAIDGNSGVLAYNFFPNTGDMVIDTADAFYTNTSNNSLRLRNTLAHEHGHGIGLSHVCPINQTKLMEPFLTTAFDGPQLDDRLGGGRGYGDANEHNDTAGTATNLGMLGAGTTTRTRLSIDDAAATDVDFFRFTTTGTTARLTMRPVGSTYLEGPQFGNGSCSAGSSFNALTLVDLGVQLIGADGSTVLATANGNAAGQTETTAVVTLPNGSGPYYARVFGGGAVANVQLYELDIIIGASTPPSATLTVDIAGSGTGTVTSSPAGITCGSDCAEAYAAGTSVALTATADAGSSLVGLIGASDCADGTVTVAADLACTAVFTRVFADDPLTAGSTEIKAAHVTELRAAIATLRTRVGLGAASYTDTTLTGGSTLVRRAHLVELRTALDAVYDAVGVARPTYSDASITAGLTPIRAVHISELRAAIRAVDAST